jgi:MFS transporter, DHA2 family, multidrug resistance protein
MHTTTTPSITATPATPRDWLGLYVLSIACMLYSMDISVLFLAMPSIVTELDPSPTQLLWINDIYGFMVAGFLVTMGTLGDRVGRRKILLLGAGAFGIASVICAFSSSATMLIIARALLGIAGATIAPSTLSLIFNMFHDESEKTRAIGVWGTAFALGGLIGPVIGGLLLTWFHWGSVFLINVPIMLGLLLSGPFLLPEFKSDHAGKLDLASVALSLAAVLPMIYGLKQVAAYGASSTALTAILLGAVFARLFIARQRVLEHPLVDLALFKSARFNVSLLVNLAGIFFIFAIFMLQNQFLQLVLNLKPLEAGLWSAGPSAVFCVMSLYAHKVSERFGAENSVIWGTAIFAMGTFVMAMAAYAGSLYMILGASVIMAIGFVPVILTTTNLIVSSAPPERAGSASAISETSAEFGGALGIALLGSLGTFIYRHLMSGIDAPAAAKATLGGAVDLAATTSPTWIPLARNAFATSYMVICLTAAAGLALLSWYARRVLGNRDRLPDEK